MKYHGLCERLWANCRVSTTHFYKGTPCWDWTGKVVMDSKGTLPYGTFTVRVKGVKHPRQRRAHRASLELFGGVKLHKSHEANHLCERTICINPLHLSRVTRWGNERYKRHLTKLRIEEAKRKDAEAFELGTRVETHGEEIPF